MLLAAVVRADQQDRVILEVDAHERLHPLGTTLGAGAREQPDLVDARGTQASLCPRDQELVDPRRNVEKTPVTGSTHGELLG